ncbi:NmrA-like family domain-containing protein 1 [Fusarium austroafricanum]|uniref:NmrA-like family domain-containing protein 1 n=1 Tax=Fusarium austroafricanum TaxID=2364996 RepID=A0A8H4KPV7_9HYPO|nr:NmrA-like family domain-containing protein 1 [Fusarium austroafricanum]
MFPTVFVTGATGSQGSAVARQLLEIGWTVRTTARNMDSPAAKKIQDLGAEVTPGDWDNEEVLKTVISGCTHMFLNLVPNMAASASEVPQAKKIIDIAKSEGVKHVIYSSGMAIKDMEKDTHHDRDHPIWHAHWRKKEIEDLVQNAGFDAWTILRPGFFMCNTLMPKIKVMSADLLQTNTWRTAYTPEVRLPMMDVEDLAKFAVAAFREPSRFNGQKIEIASEKLSPDEIMRQLGEASGRPLSVVYLTGDEIKAKMNEDFFISIQLLSRDLGDKVDIGSVKKWDIPLTTYSQFLERERAWVESTFA